MKVYLLVKYYRGVDITPEVLEVYKNKGYVEEKIKELEQEELNKDEKYRCLYRCLYRCHEYKLIRGYGKKFIDVLKDFINKLKIKIKTMFGCVKGYLWKN